MRLIRDIWLIYLIATEAVVRWVYLCLYITSICNVLLLKDSLMTHLAREVNGRGVTEKPEE